ncbi:CDP-glucose 4,6-dehydratase [Methylorubrum extorquens]|uniref:CDP-glucose 4,6-dehydratase n=1 Tax=Methylorubrum extorquens TaxID=408 RepID=A0A1S1P9Z9_METEX|nr:CDP-glucose 4,6-dehydratase [Methylorubrum extorquens]
MENLVERAYSPAFWTGRRILLTGHTGFKGAWLSLWLTSMGAKVFGYANDVPTRRSLFDDAGIANLMDDRRGDVRNQQEYREVLTEAAPEIVLHLAAQPLVRLSYAEPVLTYATNITGTVNVLEEVRLSTNPCPVLVITTDKCYENREWDWGYRENEPMGGHDPYSSSKACAELIASAYHRSYSDKMKSFSVTTARAGNVIGGGDWADDRLIPDLVRGVQSGRITGIRNPRAIRPWQHVLEPLSGYLMLARRLLDREPVDGQGWNFGPAAESEVPVSHVASKVCHLLGREEGWCDESTTEQQHEAQNLRLDITKARVRLGWHPRWTLDEALNATITIYKSQSKGEALRSLLLEQIEAYVSKQIETPRLQHV